MVPVKGGGMKVLVSGAGVGGLAVARMLLADGHDVHVYERAGGLRSGGAAVTLWPNGTGILAGAGVRLDGVGAAIDVLETRDREGKLLVATEVAAAARHYGHPNVCLPRSRLLERLAEGLPPGMVTFGRACTAAQAEGDGVRLTLCDGSEERGDLAVVADGRGSVLRDQLWGGDPGRRTGWVTWQGLSPLPIAITGSQRGVLFVGRGGTCGLMPAGEGLLQWWFDLPRPDNLPQPQSPVGVLREAFANWGAPVSEVLKAIADEDTGFFPHYTHRVPETWGTGPITVIGDAAHSMPPTRAQGANQALEDAWLLARSLRHMGRNGRALSATLRSFERARTPRVGLVSKQAGTEDYNRHGLALARAARLVPSSLAARFYTRWLGRVSNYLQATGCRASRQA
jgi:FAD-dependent urate hydroxylase